MLTVAIGYDHRESIAYHVLAHSIMRRASQPVRIVPIALNNLASIYKRERSPMQSTDFTYARFLTPWLAEDNQVSVFLDCDMLCLDDICKLEEIARANMYQDVLVVKHDYIPRTESKFLGQPQTVYPCKNWSSVMVFNGHRTAVKKLVPKYIDEAPAMDLHQFKWAQSVGELNPSWNHLVGEYSPNPDAKIVHFTLGGPYFKGYADCEYSAEWYAELRDMLHRDNPSFVIERQWL
jgi:lipopolysaccharide biosynthesis glycosyltransferase